MASGNLKNFELKIGKAGLIITAVGMAALLCTAFLVGVDIGKNIDTYPLQIATFPQRMLALVWQPAKIRSAQIIPDSKSGASQSQTPDQENIDLTFYDDLTSKKGVVREQPVPDKQQIGFQPKNEKEAAIGNFYIETPKLPVAVNEKIKDKIEPPGKEIEQIIASNKQRFLIQVASLKEKTKANKMNKKIISLGFASQISETEIKGKGIVFRIVVSGFENKVQADEAAVKISRKTGTNCLVKPVDSEKNKN